MTFSYTQVSQYLRCPRSYRFRYLDGWREKESRAALCFGRSFEKALLGLRGIVRISHTTLNHRTFLNLAGFAPASEWEELPVSGVRCQEVTRDV